MRRTSTSRGLQEMLYPSVTAPDSLATSLTELNVKQNPYYIRDTINDTEQSSTACIMCLAYMQHGNVREDTSSSSSYLLLLLKHRSLLSKQGNDKWLYGHFNLNLNKKAFLDTRFQ